MNILTVFFASAIMGSSAIGLALLLSRNISYTITAGHEQAKQDAKIERDKEQM